MRQNAELGKDWEINLRPCILYRQWYKKTAFGELIQNAFHIAFEATQMKLHSVAKYFSFTKFWISVSHVSLPGFPSNTFNMTYADDRMIDSKSKR